MESRRRRCAGNAVRDGLALHNAMRQERTVMKLTLHDLHLPMRHPFTIALGTTTVQHNLLVALEDGGHTGYGEAASSHAYAEFTPAGMRRDLEAVRAQIESAAW